MMRYRLPYGIGITGRKNEMRDVKETKSPSSKDVSDVLEIDVNEISSPALARLVEEVRNDETSTFGAYNRSYHRHNR